MIKLSIIALVFIACVCGQVWALSEFEKSKITSENIFREINKVRGSNFVKLLSQDHELDYGAMQKAEDMCLRNYFAHDYIDTKWQSFFPDRDFKGENLAEGYTTSQQVIQGWMKSDLHRDNLLNWKYSKIGIGIKTCNQETLIVVHFTN